MLPLILTGIAGLVCGVVIMRVMQTREAGPAAALADASTEESAQTRPKIPSSRQLLIGAAALAVIAVGVLAFKKDDAPTGEEAPQTASAPASKSLDDVDTMITRLQEKLKAKPDDGEGWRMLGWSLVNTGKPEQAIEPYEKAMALLPARADLMAGYGEALTGATKGIVTAQAKSQFDQAIKLDPKEPRALFFEALFKSQNGDEHAALDEWVALANTAPADASWQPDLHERIAALATKLKIDVSGKLKPTPAATASASDLPSAPPIDEGAVKSANAMPQGDRQQMIDGMVERLADKLKTNPGDADGWARLLRSRMVLNQTEQAGRDLVIARGALANNEAGLASVNAAAKQLGVPGAK